jgi:hypothetical protein
VGGPDGYGCPGARPDWFCARDGVNGRCGRCHAYGRYLRASYLPEWRSRDYRQRGRKGQRWAVLRVPAGWVAVRGLPAGQSRGGHCAAAGVAVTGRVPWTRKERVLGVFIVVVVAALSAAAAAVMVVGPHSPTTSTPVVTVAPLSCQDHLDGMEYRHYQAYGRWPTQWEIISMQDTLHNSLHCDFP